MSATATFRSDLFSGQSVLITGAARGIGAGIAQGFAAAGARLALHDMDGAALDVRAGELRDAGADVETFVCDLGQRGAAHALMDQVAQRMRQVHYLVNNAGRSWSVPTESIDTESAEALVQLNQMAVLWLSQAFIAHRRAQGGGGGIVQISSTAGITGFAHRAVYSATKHAILGLTRVLAIDHGPDGIRVNAILPHVIETPMFLSVASESEGAQWRSGIPLRRLGTPDDVAGAAVFLCSPAAAYITGSSLLVDGGAAAGI